MYNETRGKTHFWVSLISFNFAIFVQHFLGLAGMPGRYAGYPMQFADFNAVSTIGAFGFGVAQVYFFFAIVLPCMRGKGEPAARRPWSTRTAGAPKGWNGKCPLRRPSMLSKRRLA